MLVYKTWHFLPDTFSSKYNKSIDMQAVIKKGSTALIASILALNVALLVHYIFVTYRSIFHSDSAAKVLIANEIVASGNYFPADWYYVNSDLWVFFGHTFIIPLLSFLPPGYLVHAIAGVVVMLLILFSVWLISGTLPVSLNTRLMVLSIIAAGISGFTAENFYGQASYGTIFYISLFLIYASYQSIFITQSRKNIFLNSFVFVILVLVFWSNPQRALISYGLPLTAAIIWTKLISRQHVTNNLLGFSIFAVTGIFIGVLFHYFTISQVTDVLGAGNARWLSFDLMLRNIGLTFQGILAIFGGLPTPNNSVVTSVGVYEAIRLVTAVVLIGITPFVIGKNLFSQNTAFVYVTSFSSISFCLVLFFQLSTTIPDMSDPIQSSRYLLPSIVLLFLIVLLSRYDIRTSPLPALAHGLVVVVMITSAYSTYVKSSFSSPINWGMEGQHNRGFSGLADFLLQNGLQYGYGTYWNAGVISTISDGKVAVRQIFIANGLPVPMKHLSSKRWYKPNTWQGKTFLSLTEAEAKLINWERLATIVGPPVRKLNYNNYTITVFSKNIAIGLPGWDTTFETGTNFPATHYSFSHAGRFIENYSDCCGALVAEKGESGALHFGPYIEVSAGTYIATFDVIAKNHYEASVRIDVAGTPNAHVYAEKVLQNSLEPQQLTFTLDSPQVIEFRVWALGNEKVIFKSVGIKRNKQE